jgi:hypothetical protein
MINLQNHNFADKKVVIVPDDRLIGHIGPDVRFERCDAKLHATGRDFIFKSPCEFVDCTIRAMKLLRNFQDWTSVRLIGCTLFGRFIGNDFGHWSLEGHGGYGIDGRVEDCDFSQTLLDGVRFLNVDMSRVKLPGWPHFIVANQNFKP